MKEVLIVDDQPGIRLLLNEIFQNMGIKTHVAANGLEALEIAQNNTIHCILLDVKMPGMDGIEVLKQLRALNIMCPVCMMTAYGEKELIHIASQYTVQQFFTKPFNIFEVRDEVIELIQKKTE